MMERRHGYVLKISFAVILGTLVVDSSQSQTEFLDDWRPLPAHEGQTRAPLANQSTRLFIDVVTDELSAPFGIAFLPDGRILVSEGPASIRIIDADGNLSAPLEGLPSIWEQGLFDLTLHPAFETNRLLYFAYAAPPEGVDEAASTDDVEGESRRLVGRARLSNDATRLEDTEVIFEAAARRLVFAPDGSLFMSTTAAGDDGRHLAQDLTSLDGKVLRINDDGSIPRDNPYVGRDDVHAAIYSHGHRDPSGPAINPRTGELWMMEHGPRGGDELNIVRPGRNYGWPTITYGRNYDQARIGEALTAMDGMEQPLYFWVPSIAPSSLMIYTGELFPDWRGNAFVTTLSGEHLTRLVLVDDRVAAEERLLVGREQRLRTVAQGPDGAVYVLVTGDEGQLLRLRPKPPPGRFTD